MRSTRPAIQAQGRMTSEIATKPNTPARQPKSSDSAWPIGAEIMSPSEPTAETMPSTLLRSAAGTGRATTAIASPDPQQASASPISSPAPISTPANPVAVASASRPRT